MVLKDSFSNPSKQVIKNLRVMGNEATKSGRKIVASGKQISSVGAGLTKSVTAPISGIGIACIKTAADFEKSMSNVKAITNASGKDFDALKQKAIDLGDKTAWSSSEVAKAMQYTGMAGWTAADNIAGLEGILNAASATNTDLARTSDILTDAISAFGDSAKDSTRYADVLTKACTSANVTVDTLGESYKYVGAVCGTMNYSIEDATKALAVMGSAGVKGSAAGTTLKRAITNLTAPSKKTKAAMDELGISIKNSDGSVKTLDEVLRNVRSALTGFGEAEQNAYAKALFGQEAMNGMVALVNTSEKEYNRLTDAINNSSGAAKEAAEVQLDNLNGQLTRLKSKLGTISIEIGNKLLPYIKKSVTFFDNLAKKISALSDEQVNLIMKIAGIAAAVGPTLLIFGKTISTVGKVKMAFGGMLKSIAASKGIFAAISASSAPMVAVIAGIAVGAVLIIKNWDKVKSVLRNASSWISGAFNDAGISTDKMKNAISNAFSICGKAISKFIGMAKEYGPVIIDKIGGAIKTALPYIRQALVIALKIAGQAISAISDVIKKASPVISNIARQLLPVLSKAFSTVAGIAKKLAPYIGKVLFNAFKITAEKLKFFIKIAKSAAPVVGKILNAAFKIIVPSIKFAIKAFTQISNIVGKVLVIAFKALNKITSTMASIFSKAWNVASGAVSVASNAISSCINFVKPIIEEIASVATSIFGPAFSKAGELISSAFSSISQVIENAKKGFNGIIDFVTGVFAGDWETAWNGVKDIFGSIFDSLAALVKLPMNGVIGLINKAIGAINKINVTVPSWIPGIGGESFGFDIPKIDYLAKGTKNWKGGLAVTQEKGGEIIDLPRGSRVYPHDESIKMARREGAKSSKKEINITINKLADKIEVRDDGDIDKVADKFANKLAKILEVIV